MSRFLEPPEGVNEIQRGRGAAENPEKGILETKMGILGQKRGILGQKGAFLGLWRGVRRGDRTPTQERAARRDALSWVGTAA